MHPNLTAGDEAPNGARNLRIATPTSEGLEEVQLNPPNPHPPSSHRSHRSQQPLYRKCQRVEKKRFGT